MDFSRKIEARKYGDADLPVYPARTLAGHVATKGLQAGSLLGLLVATPAIARLRKKSMCSAWVIAVPVFAFVGAGAALGMLYNKHSAGQLTEDGVDDRAYRIHHNEGQRAVDRYSTVGGMVGLCSVLVWRRFRSTLATAGTGIALGVLLFTGEKVLKANKIIEQEK